MRASCFEKAGPYSEADGPYAWIGRTGKCFAAFGRAVACGFDKLYYLCSETGCPS